MPRPLENARLPHAIKRWAQIEAGMRERRATELAICAARYNWFNNLKASRTVTRDYLADYLASMGVIHKAHAAAALASSSTGKAPSSTINSPPSTEK